MKTGPDQLLGTGIDRGRLLLVAGLFLGAFLSTAAIQVNLVLRDSLTTAREALRGETVFVQKKVGIGQTLGWSDPSIPEETVRELEAALPGVRIERVTRNHFVAALRLGGGNLPEVFAEVFFESVPDDLLDEGLRQRLEWSPGAEFVPVVVPRYFLTLYNFGYAPSKGLPRVTESLAGRFRFDLIAGGEGRGRLFQGRIVGFSDRIESLLVPRDFLETMNAELGRPGAGSGASDRLVLAFDARIPSGVTRILGEHGLVASRDPEAAGELVTVVNLASVALAGLAVLILVLAGSLAWQRIEGRIRDERRNFDILFFLGHAPRDLARLFVRRNLVLLVAPVLAGAAAAPLAGHFLLGEFVPGTEPALWPALVGPLLAAGLTIVLGVRALGTVQERFS